MNFFSRSVKLLILLFTGVVLVSTLENEVFEKVTRNIKNALLDIETRGNVITLSIIRNGTHRRNVFHTRNTNLLNQPFVLDVKCGTNKICVKSGNVIHTIIESSLNSEVIKVSRSVPDPNAEIIACHELGEDTQWFGGPQIRYQIWPIQNMRFEEEPYVPTHPSNMAVTERYWFSSKGISLFVNETDPLFLDQNNYKLGYICFIAKNKAPYRHRQSVTLNYEIGVYANPRVAHENVARDHFRRPKSYPDERMIRHPIWSTWARYKANVSESVVETFGNEIINNKFNNSQLEIDDNWETCYGSAEFDLKKFPNITSLVQRLKRKNFRVTLWIHPFINVGCEPAFTTALKNGYFVKSITGNVHTSWWQGQDAAAIDFTNPKAVQWWVARLKRLEQKGIDGFKFDAGETSWVPQTPSLTGGLNMQPGIYTYDYVNALAKNFDDKIEVRVGWRSQDLPIFVRMIDKDTRWTWNNGIPTLITTLLQMNMNGYSYVLPDMIGGNGYVNNSFNATEYPSKELFIRWLQSNVFMPSLQYSFVPWDYDAETITICRLYTDLHAEFTPIILNAMRKFITSGTPINPPIWWIDPENKEAHKVYDEYLLGEDILVAPVIEEGATVRDVYLPSGLWRDGNTNKNYTGPIRLFDYPAPLNILPYFIRTR